MTKRPAPTAPTADAAATGLGDGAEEVVWDLEKAIREAVLPSRRKDVDAFLEDMDRQQQRRSLGYLEEAWRALGRWLVEQGQAPLWARAFRDLAPRHAALGTHNGYAPGDEWQFLYGPPWRSTRPDLAALTPEPRAPDVEAFPA